MFVPVDKIIIKCLNHNVECNNDFVRAIYELYNVDGICALLKINRNRYYYLQRNRELDNEILKLRKGVK